MQTEKYIRSFLEQWNANRLPPTCFPVTRKLSKTVFLARIWDLSGKTEPVMIYLVALENVYVGAVMEKESELYAYSLPAYRRKGFMKAALQTIILPIYCNNCPS